MRTQTVHILSLALVASLTGCELIASVDRDKIGGEDDTEGKYAIDDNLAEDVEVELGEDNIGTIILDLEAPLPEPEEGDDELLDLIGTKIDVTVRKEGGTPTWKITQGVRVERTPSAEKEYNITTAENARDLLRLQFMNEIDGYSLRADVDYEVLIEVSKNPYFVKEDLVRPVMVTSAADN